jgi:hypothetical protein
MPKSLLKKRASAITPGLRRMHCSLRIMRRDVPAKPWPGTVVLHRHRGVVTNRIDCTPAAVDRSEQIQPFTADLNIRLIDSPRATRVALIPADQLLQLRSVLLDPTVDRGVMNFEATLLHHLRQVPIANVELQVPAHAQQNELGRKVTSLETVRHPSILCEALFATEPACLKSIWTEAIMRTFVRLRQFLATQRNGSSSHYRMSRSHRALLSNKEVPLYARLSRCSGWFSSQRTH